MIPTISFISRTLDISIAYTSESSRNDTNWISLSLVSFASVHIVYSIQSLQAGTGSITRLQLISTPKGREEPISNCSSRFELRHDLLETFGILVQLFSRSGRLLGAGSRFFGYRRNVLDILGYLLGGDGLFIG